MSRSEVLAILSEVLDVAPGTLKGGEKLKGLDGWDSLAVVSFMSMMDERLGVLVQPEDIACCVTVDDLAALSDIHR